MRTSGHGRGRHDRRAETPFPAGTRNDGLVSVVIPCYNQGTFLGEAIESVLSQSYQPTEVVVVDDGSTDATRAVVLRYDVKYVYQQNGGLAGARNRGILESSGAFLVFLDADDRLLPGALATGAASLDACPGCAFVYGRYQHIAGDGSFLRPQEPPPYEPDLYLALLRSNHIAMHATVMYRRGVFDTVGVFDRTLRAAEDYDLYLRIARRFPIQRHDAIVAEYREHPSNMSRDAVLMLRSIVRVHSRERKHVRDRPKYRDAWAQGMNGSNREYYLDLLRTQVRGWRSTGAPLRRQLRLGAALLRWDPKGLAKALAPRVYWALSRCSDAARNWVTQVLARSDGRTGAIVAIPNPIRVTTGHWNGPGATTIEWNVKPATAIEIRVNRSDGPLFSAGTTAGSATTGQWVVDGTRFFLLDVSDSAHGRTLAVVTVIIIPE